MPIVSSVLEVEPPQRDSRFWAHEAHTDQLGLVYHVRYLAVAQLNTAAEMAARVPGINADLLLKETERDIAQIKAFGSLAVIKTDYVTLAVAQAALRIAYLTATQVEAIMIGDFLSSLTSGQLQTLFSMTAGQVTTLRTNKLTPAATAAASIRSASGA